MPHQLQLYYQLLLISSCVWVSSNSCAYNTSVCKTYWRVVVFSCVFADDLVNIDYCFLCIEQITNYFVQHKFLCSPTCSSPLLELTNSSSVKQNNSSHNMGKVEVQVSIWDDRTYICMFYTIYLSFTLL